MSNPLKVTFTDNSAMPDPIWIGFWSNVDNTDITKIDGTKIVKINNGKWYKFSELQEGVLISKFIGGQIYVQYGGVNGWQPTPKGGKPSSVNPDDPAYQMRYDFVELTVTPAPADVADLTIIDSWSIPFTLKSYKDGKLLDTLNALKSDVDAQTLYHNLAGITTPPQSGLDDATPAAVWDGSNFVRVIGPTAYPPTEGKPAIPYDLFSSYLQYLFDTFGPGTIASIKGTYGGDDSQASPLRIKQTYDLKLSLDSDLNLTLDGSLGVAGSTKMYFAASDLKNSPGIYGGNVSFTLKEDNKKLSPENDVYGWICGDLFTGFTTGAIGSDAVVEGQRVGSMPSESWFVLKNPAMKGNYFGKLQSNAKFYNQWANAVYANTNAYGYAYAERYSGVHLSLNPETVDSMEIVLMPAAIKKS
jgi:hypothetical protein